MVRFDYTFPTPPPPNKIFFKKINYRLIHFLHLPTPQIKQKLKEIKLQADSFLEIKPISNTTGKLYKKNRIILYQKNRRNTYKYTLYLLVITLQSSTEYFNNSKKKKRTVSLLCHKIWVFFLLYLFLIFPICFTLTCMHLTKLYKKSKINVTN